MGAPTAGLLPSTAYHSPSSWQPSHMNDPPEAPPLDTREAELAALAAQEKLGHDGKRQRVRPRRTIDPFGGLERWKIVRHSFCILSRQISSPSFRCSSAPPRLALTISSSCDRIQVISSTSVHSSSSSTSRIGIDYFE